MTGQSVLSTLASVALGTELLIRSGGRLHCTSSWVMRQRPIRRLISGQYCANFLSGCLKTKRMEAGGVYNDFYLLRTHVRQQITLFNWRVASITSPAKAMPRPESNPRPHDHESNALPYIVFHQKIIRLLPVISSAIRVRYVVSTTVSCIG